MTKTKKCRVVVRAEYCKGCGLCVKYCSKNVLVESENLNRGGYHYAEAANDECVGCMICTIVCPEVAIEVYDE